jgi:hypothetical protein
MAMDESAADSKKRATNFAWSGNIDMTGSGVFDLNITDEKIREVRRNRQPTGESGISSAESGKLSSGFGACAIGAVE